jgi:hypothetical protein
VAFPVDFAASSLARWMQPQHLGTAAVTDLARRLADRSDRCLVIDDFLMPDRLARIRGALVGDGVMATGYRLFSQKKPVTRDRFEAAPDSDRFFVDSLYQGPQPGREMAPSVLQDWLLRQEMTRPPWLAWLSAVTGQSVGGVQTIILNRMRQENRLGWHSDAIDGRKACMVIYLHEDWQPTYGGRLLMRQCDGGIEAIEPRFNRLVLFVPIAEAKHAVEPISPEADDWWRMNYAAWFC